MRDICNPVRIYVIIPKLTQKRATTPMCLTDGHSDFDSHDHDPYYDWTTEDDGDIPDVVDCSLDFEIDQTTTTTF